MIHSWRKEADHESYGTFKFDIEDGEERLAELMLHVANRCQDDLSFGATKLNKILWWSDFLSYARTGKPITGVEYQRLGNGPAPKRLVPIRDELVKDKGAVVQRRARGPVNQKRLIPLRAVNYDLFTADQIAFVDEIIDWLWGKTAASVSEDSHKAWKIAKNGQSMPYESIFLSDAPITRFDVLRTHELAEEFGWARA